MIRPLVAAQILTDWPHYSHGWIQGYGQPGNRLYVNRGIGFSVLPIHFACLPPS